MSEFSKNVVRVFSDLIEHYGFVPAHESFTKDAAALVKKLNDHVFIHLFVRDYRGGDSNMQVYIWIAPPDFPDDGFDNLGIGFKLIVGSQYDVNDGFFAACQTRVVTLLQHVNGLEAAVEEEIANPPFRRRRTTVYGLERRLFLILKERNTGQADGRVGQAFASAVLAAKGKSPFSRLETDCIEAVKYLVEAEALEDELIAFYEGNTAHMGAAVSRQLYIHALGELSESAARS